eukprot:m.18295 g.18295  ORF g.18295 m.18295 type:complete len:452 (-) comp7779_c0_seq1:298-1653(-)
MAEDATSVGMDEMGDIPFDHDLIDDDEDVEYLDDNVVDGEVVEEEDGMDAAEDQRVYLPGDSMTQDQQLVMDPSVYSAYLTFFTEWPCLSFDVLPDALGDNRTGFPATCFMVAGTQAAEASLNRVSVLKVSNITKNQGDDSDDEDDEDDLDTEPQLDVQSVNHRGGVNRVRVAPHPGCIAATMSDSGKAHIFDLSGHARLADDPTSGKEGLVNEPLFTYTGHKSEGFALDWSPVNEFALATGDCSSGVAVWSKHEGGTWEVTKAQKGHTASVEDIQWSPSEPTVFASCSVDKTIRIWDTRIQLSPVLAVTAHDCDVNVMSWNRREQHLLVSGADDGTFKVWDLRTFQSDPEAIAEFKWHTSYITSIEWHPNDASVLGVSGADDQISLWDLAVEEDAESGVRMSRDKQVPPQLLFVHQGQKNIKEMHWHPQMPGYMLSTAESGFNVFKTISV